MELIKKEIVDFFKNNNLEIAETIELGDANTEYTFTFVLAGSYLKYLIDNIYRWVFEFLVLSQAKQLCFIRFKYF